MTFLRILLTLSIAVTSICCSSSKEPQKKSQSVIRIRQVGWTLSETATFGIDESQFKKLVNEEFAGIKSPVSRRVSRGILVEGALDVREGKAALILEMRIKLERLSFPLMSMVAASAMVDSDEAAMKLVRNALKDLAQATDGMLRLVDADVQAQIEALSSPEPDVQILAINLLGQARERRAVVDIARVLDDPREPVVEAAATALARIGDESAVPLLIKAIKRGDLRSEVRAIEAMGAIGGEEAELYLEMTAIGHQVKEVQILSAQMLEGIRARKSSKKGR